ncbi:hypothetical protein [Promicromonospora sp. NPDC060271]|uniref:hypothetical protein n=1 Tax=Promicromonospora sp. NPDC060271 TaxID=3347089 RepID=UPI0036662E93
MPTPPENSPVPPEPLEAAKAVAREGKHVDKGLDAVDWFVTLLGVAGAPVSAWLNPSLQEAAGDGWIAFTLATFTWTAGCALGVVVLLRSGVRGFPLVLAVGACYVVALVVASLLGQGVLEITAPQSGLGPFNLIATVVVAALAAYGPLGFFLAGGIGTWLGFRLSPHVPKGFLA